MRLGFLLFVAYGLVSCGTAPPATRIIKRPLVQLPSTYRAGALAVGDDGLSWVFAVRTPDGVSISSSGGPGGSYKETSPPQLTLGSLRPYFWALDVTGPTPRAAFIMGAVSTPTPFARPSPVTLSADGTHWAVAGAIGPLTEQPPGLTPMVMLVDGVERGRAYDTTRPDFSPDGTHVAWLAEDDAGTVTLVRDGTVTRTYTAPVGSIERPISTPIRRSSMASDMAAQYFVRYLSDGRLLALVRDAAGWTVERDGTALASYAANTANRQADAAPDLDPFAGSTAILPESIVTAEAAPVAVWWERAGGGQWRIVRDGQPIDGIICLTAWTAQPPAVSSDGAHVGYVCATRDATATADPPRAYVVVDGRRHGPYVNVWGLRLSDDGTRAAWAAATSRDAHATWDYFFDGRPLAAGYQEAWRPRIDPTNQHVAWLGRRAEHVQLGLDARAHATVDEVLWGPKFTAAHTLSWVVRRGLRVVRLDVPVT